jgi:acyl-CoA dehydrogenase
MDNDIFEQFTEQLRRYIRERLIPAEKEVLEGD